ncbi:hypothetical protein AVL62_02215 [Serinicoccus chungangensis]|uniref:Uncharacterized protein n=1 Tax=Serinicoccus chungangensis TaxID=767452 RepID=A0A0W8I658_9MICO|nr:HNH endonuclease [Serinicoccus chungangensis]KUG53617.1 hypothetical protein AVL62_02215 [Serinicoccus chungangensis]
MTAEWALEVGDLTNRREMMERYGGSRFGGIEPSNRSPNVLIYSDPKQGIQHGYNYDGWDPDADSPFFYYTGEGQRGDQNPESKGNRAILRHLETGPALRLFEAAGPNRGGGKPQLYIGEFHIDPVDPWRFREAPDRDGLMRQVVVHKLVAVEPARSRAVSQAGMVTHPLEVDVPFDERKLREVALRWLEQRTDGGRQALSLEDLRDFEGGYDLASPAVELWQPPGFEALLSIRDERDVEGEQVQLDGLTLSPESSVHIESLRVAEVRRFPLIWLQSIGGARYLAMFPLYVAARDGADFLLSPDETFGRLPEEPESALEVVMKRYVLAETKRRLHQPVFRAHVLRAYERRCAVCALRHVELLDAAHIVPDAHELGVPAIHNGMAMCKLHHAAYDANLLGVTPERRIEIPPRIMTEVDGPTLKYGLQGRHGQDLMILPASQLEWPDPELLTQRYEQFRAASAVG